MMLTHHDFVCWKYSKTGFKLKKDSNGDYPLSWKITEPDRGKNYNPYAEVHWNGWAINFTLDGGDML
jgi:hypothetical protein